jgi:midasin (ATPase involved in ribosome maturation)
VYQESLMVRAIQSPSVILFDEVNAMSNTHTFDFHALLQNRELFIKDARDGKGHVYKLHPECRIGFAQNPKSAKYIGGNIKPSNFLGRCTFLTYPEFTIDEIQQAMEKKFPKIKPAEIQKFVTFYFASVKLIEQADIPLDISIRQLINVIDLWHHGMEIQDAINDGMASMTEAISQPKAKESFYRVAQGVWKELMTEVPNPA